MYKIFWALRHNLGKIIMVAVIGVTAAFVISSMLRLNSPGAAALQSTPTPYPERTWHINESLTIGDFTVHLHKITDTADGLRVSQSYQTNVSELDYLPIDSTEIKYADESIANARRSRLPSPGEDVNMSLGSFIVADTSLTGSVDIPLASVSESGEVSPQPELLIGSRIYGIAKLVFMQDRIALTVQPRNEAAKRGTIGMAAGVPVNIILNDDSGTTYKHIFGSASFEPFDQSVSSQEIIFGGVQKEYLSSVTELTLTIQGGGNIVGPFVFENIALVSEAIPPVTPAPPGGEDDGGGGVVK